MQLFLKENKSSDNTFTFAEFEGIIQSIKNKKCTLNLMLNVSNCTHRQEFTHCQLLWLNEWRVICEYESKVMSMLEWRQTISVTILAKRWKWNYGFALKRFFFKMVNAALFNKPKIKSTKGWILFSLLLSPVRWREFSQYSSVKKRTP